MHAHELTVPDRQIHFIAAAHSLSRKRPSADDTSCDAEPMPRQWKSAAGTVQPPGRKDQHALTWIRATRRSSLGKVARKWPCTREGKPTGGPPRPAPAGVALSRGRGGIGRVVSPGMAASPASPSVPVRRSGGSHLPALSSRYDGHPTPLHAVGPRFTQPSLPVRTDRGAQPTAL